MKLALPTRAQRWSGPHWGWLVVTLAVGFLAGRLIDESGARDVTIEAEPESHAPGGLGESAAAFWTCSMHPSVHVAEPGRCPLCGMELVQVKEHALVAQDPTRITLTERARALSRIRTAPVKRQGAGAEHVRLLGRVDFDETRARIVTAWAAGRIERLHVATTGQTVRAGQVVATIYSPELYAAQQDLLVAARQAPSPAADAARAAARQRLTLLGVPEVELAGLERQDKPALQVSVRTPYGGTVIERMVSEGSYVEAGMGLYRLTALDRLWVQMDAYETDLARLKVGQSVSVEVSGLTGESFAGRITFIDPVLAEGTRTARVRVEVDNPRGNLRPGVFATAVVDTSVARSAEAPLVVPESAPLFAGRRALVYVEVPGMEQPTYQAREVSLGARVGGVYPVLHGLREGERVVVHGAFALDADLQLRGGASLGSLTEARAEAFAGMLPVTPALRADLGAVVTSYLGLAQTLAQDALPGAQQAAAALTNAVRAVRTRGEVAAAAEAWDELARQLLQHGARVGGATSLTQAREGFLPLSHALVKLLQRFGNPTNEAIRLAYCPMAANDAGASWVQRGATVANAYFGAEMPTCGEVRATLEPGEYLPAQFVEFAR